MTGQLRLELVKLARPLAVWSAWATFGVGVVLASIYQASATGQYQIAVDTLRQFAHPTSTAEVCRFLSIPVGPACEQARQEQVGSARQLIGDTRQWYRLAAAVQDPLGAAGVAAGLVSSLAGVLVLAGMAGGHVGGEWSLGTVKVLLAGDPGRVRFVLGKFWTLWLGGTGLLVVGWLGLLAAGPLFRRWYAVPPPPAGFSMWGYAGGQVARALLVLGAVAALGTLAGVLTRNPLGTFGLLAGFAFASMAASVWPATFQLTYGYWVAAWMGFAPVNLWVDHVWIDRFPLLGAREVHPDPLVGLVGLAATVMVALALAALRMRTTDVGG